MIIIIIIALIYSNLINPLSMSILTLPSLHLCVPSQLPWSAVPHSSPYTSLSLSLSPASSYIISSYLSSLLFSPSINPHAHRIISCSQLVESFCTDRDDIIRLTDRPERFQDIMDGRTAPSGAPLPVCCPPLLSSLPFSPSL